MIKIKLQDVSKGDILWERGKIQIKILSSPERTYQKFDDILIAQWKCKAVRIEDGKEFEYCVTQGAEQFGPSLYLEPKEIEEDENI